MSEMVEHVARALIEAHGDQEAMPADDYLRMARAAIVAMREPHPEMLDAGLAISTLRVSHLEAVYRAMIDAALAQ